jgi:OCT family organic cation transporter-like MFS transporter 4/5
MEFSGLSLNVSNLGGDVYLNFLLTSLAEIVGFLLCMPLLNRVGRKPVYIISLLSGGVALVLTIFPILYGSQGNCTPICLQFLYSFVVLDPK